MAIGFESLKGRLLDRARDAVRRGEVSERRLARMCGYSQPHLHNVLAGVRGLQAGVADRLLAALDLSALDLLTSADGASEASSLGANSALSRIPLLEGQVGAGKPFPRKPWRPRHLHFSGLDLPASTNPAAVLVSPLENAMWPTVSPGDLAVLDRSPATRRSPSFGGVYALFWRGRGYLRRCQRVGHALLLAVDQETAVEGPPARLEPENRGILHVVRGRVVWLSRHVSLDVYDEG